MSEYTLGDLVAALEHYRTAYLHFMKLSLDDDMPKKARDDMRLYAERNHERYEHFDKLICARTGLRPTYD